MCSKSCVSSAAVLHTVKDEKNPEDKLAEGANAKADDCASPQAEIVRSALEEVVAVAIIVRRRAVVCSIPLGSENSTNGEKENRGDEETDTPPGRYQPRGARGTLCHVELAERCEEKALTRQS